MVYKSPEFLDFSKKSNFLKTFRIFRKIQKFWRFIYSIRFYLDSYDFELCFRYVSEKHFFSEVGNFWQKFLYEILIPSKAKKSKFRKNSYFFEKFPTLFKIKKIWRFIYRIRFYIDSYEFKLCFRYVFEKHFFSEVGNFWQKFLPEILVPSKAKKMEILMISNRNFCTNRYIWSKIFGHNIPQD